MKQNVSDIRLRFLELMEEVIRSGACPNRTVFADTVGIYLQNLPKIEQGERKPTTENIARACETYGYSANWILLDRLPKKLSKKKPTVHDALEIIVREIERKK